MEVVPDFDISRDAELELLLKEAAELKEEAKELMIRSCIEAIGAGGALVADQAIVAGGGIYYASKDLQKACQKYNVAIKLEEQARELDPNFKNEQEPWWKFWK